MEEVDSELSGELVKPETLIPLFLASLVAAVGTYWAFVRGTSDFPVFYESWKLVLAGRGAELYHATPDRFLYAPGFAWILSPLGLLPKDLSLALWCFAKAAVIGYCLRALSRGFGNIRYRVPLGLAAWAVVLTARPLLIDFQYGQVNTFLLGACVWALATHFDSKASGLQRYSAWFMLGVWATAKLIVFPLFLVPIFSYSKGRSDRQLIAATLGVAVLLLLPLLGVDSAGCIQLLYNWKDALLSRGLPLESHNQSFSALLWHYLSGTPTRVVSEAGAMIQMGWGILSPQVISALTFAWSGLTFVGFFTILASKRLRNSDPVLWSALLISLLFVPSHLVWKPYFLLGLPLVAYGLKLASKGLLQNQTVLGVAIMAVYFLGMNFTGFDFIGHDLAARIEGASVMLLFHLTIVLYGLISLSRRSRSRGL